MFFSLLIFSFILRTNFSTKAYIVYPVVNWYQDSDYAYAFTDSKVHYLISTSNTQLTETEIVSILDEWSNESGVPIAKDTIFTDVEISIKWISYAEANSTFGVGTGVLGLTHFSGITNTVLDTLYEDDRCINQQEVLKTDKMDIYIIYDNTSSDLIDTDEWKTIIRHEIGHAFGYKGHIQYSDDLMYAYWSDGEIINIIDYDSEHINNIYSFR